MLPDPRILMQGAQLTALLPFYRMRRLIIIKSDVIDSDLPLLLSKSAMKKANVKIDFSNDVINMLNQKIKFVFTASGHYAVPSSKTSQLEEEFDK